jgi:hypothetical protein
MQQRSQRLALLAQAMQAPLELEALDALVAEGSPALQAAHAEVREARRIFDPIVQWLGQRRDMPLTAGNLQDALEGIRNVQAAEYRFWLTWALEAEHAE